MISKLLNLFNRHKQIVIYVIFGALTTFVDFAVYYLIYNLFAASATLSNVFAWLAAVLFAFLTNKSFVFKSKDWSFPVILSEILKFSACRVVSGAVETAILFVAVDFLHGNGNAWKLIVSLVVIALNYVGSKVFVFKA